ncbi:MAG: hypothetical protein COB53_05095, partial [Elusimicrobia bacterium]
MQHLIASRYDEVEMAKRYKQLTHQQRDLISVYLAQKMSLRRIARKIACDVSTVSREIKRNAAPVNTGYYLPNRAQERADARKALAHERQRIPKPALRAFITYKLKCKWSPERIAGRWKMLGHKPISFEAIYQWIYADSRNLVPFLARSHFIRQKRRHTKKHRGPHIPSRIS